ncbi:Ankyrin-like protein, partial [mine drainage metagenome]
MMLAHGGNPDITVPEIFGTALLTALEQRRFANVRLLLLHGADVNQRDAAGLTSAEYAVELQQYGLAEEMLDKGYDYKLQDLANSVDRLKLGPNATQQVVRERMQLVKRLQRMGYYPEQAKFFTSFPPPGISPYQYHIVLT